MAFEVPSGRWFDLAEFDFVRWIKTFGFLEHREKPYELESGIQSNVFIAGSSGITDQTWFERYMGSVVRKTIEPGIKPTPCLIGVSAMGTVLAQAACMRRHLQVSIGSNMCHRILREVKKGDPQTWVEGRPDFEEHKYWLVAGVATSGDAIFDAAEKIKEDGYPARPPVFILIDRQHGAVERLQAAGFETVVVGYNLLDIAYACTILCDWPDDVVRQVEEEINALKVS